MVDVFARVGEFDVGAIRCNAAIAVIGRKHVRQTLHERLASAITGDSERSTVHIHFSVAHLVEPRPGEGVVSGSELLGNGEIILVGDFGTGAVSHVASLSLSRTTTLNGLDDLPHRVLVGLEVCSNRNLTRTAAVHSSSLERKLLLASLSVDVAGSSKVIYTRSLLAWEVGSIGKERAVIEVILSVGDGVCHENVGTSQGGQARNRDGFREHDE